MRYGIVPLHVIGVYCPHLIDPVVRIAVPNRQHPTIVALRYMFWITRLCLMRHWRYDSRRYRS